MCYKQRNSACYFHDTYQNKDTYEILLMAGDYPQAKSMAMIDWLRNNKVIIRDTIISYEVNHVKDDMWHKCNT